jgi:hypothetical protein
MLKASTAIAPGSGCNDTNLSTLALSLDANKSIVGIKVMCMNCSKMSVSNDHYKLDKKSRDRASAVEFIF